MQRVLTDVDVDLFIEEGLKLDPNFSLESDTNSRIFPFNINDHKYEVRADIKTTSDGKTIREFKFYLMNNPKSPMPKDFNNDIQYQIALKKSQVGITGTGNYFSVLTRVINIIAKYCENEKLNFITFTANEENRQGVYRKILKKLSDIHNLPYTELKYNPIDGSVLSDEEFWMERTI